MKKHKYLLIFGAVMLLAAALLVSKSFADQEVVIGGRASFFSGKDGKIDSLSEEDAAKYDLLILKKGDQYYWASNENKKLIKIELESDDGKKKSTVFVNLEGEGQIFVRHSGGTSCDLKGSNYNEYRTTSSGDGFKLYSGFTDPYPYPVPQSCSNWN